MNINKAIILLSLAALIANADLTTVNVPSTMLHEPGLSLGYAGKIEYYIQAGGYDSIYASLEIVPQGTATAVTLSEASGDIGMLHIVNPRVAEKKEIFFQVSGSPSGMYVARITAVAESSGIMKDIEVRLAAMSFNDKVTILGGNGMATYAAGGIPAITMADGPHGVRGNNATLFPCCVGLACTWDTVLAYWQGVGKGHEFRAQGKNCSLGPALNLVYHPQQGRAFEYYAEDPWLSGKMAASDVRGLQSTGTIATVKHYACNQQESNRNTMSSVVDERSLQELYLKNFRRPVLEGPTIAVMSSYNKINGSYATSNKYLITDVLRNQYGFKGLHMTDWGAFDDNFQASALYGADLKMNRMQDYTVANFQTVGDSIVNMHMRRIIYANEMIGAFKSGYSPTAFGSYLLSDTNRLISRTVGTHGIILAKNTGNILPIPNKGVTIALTGPYANTCRLGGGGSSAVTPTVRITPQQGITELLAAVGAGASTITTNLATANYIVVFVGVTGEGEGSDRPSLSLSSGNTEVAAALAANPTHTIVVFTGGSAASAGTWSTAPAVVIALYPGQEQGYAIADVLFGKYNPSGKLPITFPVDATQVPTLSLVNLNLNYTRADTAHGYFRVNKLNQQPLFAFGHGLSYTTFAYSNLSIYPTAITAGDRVTVEVDVKNTGAIAGEEVAQLYLSLPFGTGVPVRIQDLRGFRKVALAPGATTRVQYTITSDDMAYFDDNGTRFTPFGDGMWKVLAGSYKDRIGTSSDVNEQPSVSSTFTVQ